MELKGTEELTFKPKIKNMFFDTGMNEGQISPSEIHQAAIQKKEMIPMDTHQSRETFKGIPGMAKFLEKQYFAMLKREKQKLVEYNLGKLKEDQLTLEQVTQPGFAYVGYNGADNGQFQQNQIDEVSAEGFTGASGSIKTFPQTPNEHQKELTLFSSPIKTP